MQTRLVKVKVVDLAWCVTVHRIRLISMIINTILLSRSDPDSWILFVKKLFDLIHPFLF